MDLLNAKDRSNKYYFLKFRSVLEIIKRQNNNDSDFIELLNRLQQIKYNQLIKYSSDFLKGSVHIYYGSLSTKNKEYIDLSFNNLKINIFDSLFNFLPDESTFKIKSESNCIPLLKHNLLIETELPNNTLVKKSEKSFLLREVNKELTFNKKSISCTNSLYNDSLKLLKIKHSCLFELAYINDVTDNFYALEKFAKTLVKVLDIIQETDNLLFKRIKQNLNYIVLLGDKKNGNPPSFSTPILKSTIFLSNDLVYNSLFQLTINLVHEYAHCELHYFQDTILFIPKNETKKHYSPWREDPRPPIGIVHAIYVSYIMINFLVKLHHTKNKYFDREEVLEEIKILNHQIRIGINQCEKINLSPFSEELLEKILKNNNFIENKFDINNSVVPSKITDHLKKFTLENPLIEINKADNIV